LIPSQAPGSLQGAVYYWEDAGVDPGGTYYYKLEAIDLYGAATVHGPVSAAWPAQPAYAVYLPLVTR